MKFLFCVLSYAIAQTVPTLNMNAYYGRWVQMYSNYIVKSKLEKNIVCESAYYYPYPNNTIAVVNSGNIGGYDGNLSIVRGWAKTREDCVPGALTVYLKSTGGLPTSYWIYKLGPVVNGQYEYSVVSDEIKLSLFVLVRNYTKFVNEYNREVIEWLFANGFDHWYNLPILTNQSGCVYPEIYFT